MAAAHPHSGARSHSTATPFEIVGITAPGFFGVEVGRHFDVAVPLCAEALSHGLRSDLDRNDSWFLAAIGRPEAGLDGREGGRPSPRHLAADLQGDVGQLPAG
jgi:hypothetical protein